MCRSFARCRCFNVERFPALRNEINQLAPGIVTLMRWCLWFPKCAKPMFGRNSQPEYEAHTKVRQA